ncbi:MAG: type III-A CRISPR-associated protein Cas10/Csm1 [Spirochaetes bacterium]|nr:MAG: type III-A CRISPR-associated protein Cas10/Csm1 [Spirochaetota bacterium]
MDRGLDSEFYEVVLAGLLHDIGKFAQRTGLDKYKKTEMEGQLCKKAEKGDYYTHQHVLYTLGVLESFKGIFPDGIDIINVINLASSHHNPSKHLDKIISHADIISSGHDRRSEKELENEKNQKYYEKPLISVLWSVSLPGKVNGNEENCKLPLKKLSPETIFPRSDISISKKDYLELWEDFENDLYELRNLDIHHFLSALNTILEQYTLCIPSTTVDDPDISLYDHLITTAAFSAVLYKYHKQTESLDSDKSISDTTKEKFLFVIGDVSGIQRYIFNLKTTKHNAKMLRAKSFEIQYIAQSVANTLLEECGLPIFCALMNAGGRFLLVLPNTEKTAKILKDFRRACESFFLERYFGELSLNISKGVSVAEKDLIGEKAKELFRKLSFDSAEAKQKKLQTALSSVENHIIGKEYKKIQEYNLVCKNCDCRAVVYDNEEKLCPPCKVLVTIGTKLPKVSYIGFKPLAWKRGKLDFSLKDVLLREEESDFPPGIIINTVNSYTPGKPLYSIPYHIPVNSESGDPLTFEKLAEKNEGAKKIAMFKADLDNLGAIFSFGLKKRLSISRYVSLSRSINYFFSTWLNHEIKNYKKNNNPSFSDIYTVFSGGDDLCVIGPWERVIDFALHVRKKFAEFTAGNTSLTISGGIVLAGSSLPVSSIAHSAEEALDASKELDGKNALTIFNTTMKWDEAEEMVKAGEKITRLLKENGKKEEKIGHGIVYRLIEYSDRALKVKNGNIKSKNVLWRSHFFYDVARNLKNLEKDDMEWFISLADEHSIKYLRVPASYALYRLRKKT